MTAKTQTAPMFEVTRGVTTMAVKDTDNSVLTFNADRVGPMSYWNLREAQYGPEGMNFVQPTFGELAPLVYASLATNATEQAKQVVSTLRNSWMTGRTMTVTGKEGLLIDDDPSLELLRGNISAYEKSLRGKLGKRQEDGIVYSDDGNVRFVPYGFKFYEQSTLQFAGNPGLIAILGSKPRAEMLAKAAEFYRSKPWLGQGFDKTDSAQLRVPGVVDLLVGCLVVFGGEPVCDNGGSFGVRGRGEAARA